MKHSFKKPISVLLCLVSMLGCLAFPAHAADTGEAEPEEAQPEAIEPQQTTAARARARLANTDTLYEDSTGIPLSFNLKNSASGIASVTLQSDTATIVGTPTIQGDTATMTVDVDKSLAERGRIEATLLLQDGTSVTADAYWVNVPDGIYLCADSYATAYDLYYGSLYRQGRITMDEWQQTMAQVFLALEGYETVPVVNATAQASSTVVRPGDETQTAPPEVGALVSGHLYFKDASGVTHPLRYAKVTIYAVDFSNNSTETYDCTAFTDGNGYYSCRLSRLDITAIKVKVHAGNDGVQVMTRGGSDYILEHLVNFWGSTTSPQFDYTFVIGESLSTMTTEYDWGKAMHVAQSMILANKYAKAMFPDMFPLIHISFPSEQDQTGYRPDLNEIMIADTDKESSAYVDMYAAWDVHMHEYAHYCFDVMNLLPEDATGFHGYGENATEERGKLIGMKLAWSEAIASVFSLMAQQYYSSYMTGFPFAGDTACASVDLNVDIENHTLHLGDGYEFAIAAILWDVFDPANEPHDTISMSHTAFWSTIKASKAETFSDFSTYYMAHNPSNISAFGKLLENEKFSPTELTASNLSIDNCPTFSFLPNGSIYILNSSGTPVKKYNDKFQIKFYTTDGTFITQTPFFTRTSSSARVQYTISSTMWNLILTSAGSEFQWSVYAYQTNDFVSGPYCTTRTTTTKPSGNATWLRTARAFSGTIAESGEYVWYYFTALQGGTYKFYTTGTLDTYGDMFNNMAYRLSTTGRIDYNDNSGSGSNFSITKHLDAGQTVYIRVRAVGTATGSFVMRADLVQGDISIESLPVTAPEES